mgnify:FL=1
MARDEIVFRDHYRDKFIFRDHYYEAVKKLPKEQQAELLDAICEYVFYDNEIEMSDIVSAAFILMRDQIDSDSEEAEWECESLDDIDDWEPDDWVCVQPKNSIKLSSDSEFWDIAREFCRRNI